MRDAIFRPVFTFENLIDSFIWTIMSDTGAYNDCTINYRDIAIVDKDLDLSNISVSSECSVDLNYFDILSESDNNNGDVDVHVDDNNHIFSNVLTLVLPLLRPEYSVW